MSKETKECINCFSEIDARAKECKYCYESQTPEPKANFFRNHFEGQLWNWIALIAFLSLIAFLTYKKDVKSENKKLYTELSTEILKIQQYDAWDAKYVACLGRITNPTAVSFYNLAFEVVLFDDEGKLLHAFSFEDDEIAVPNQDSVMFRVWEVDPTPSTKPHKCETRITGASI